MTKKQQLHMTTNTTVDENTINKDAKRVGWAFSYVCSCCVGTCHASLPSAFAVDGCPTHKNSVSFRFTFG